MKVKMNKMKFWKRDIVLGEKYRVEFIVQRRVEEDVDVCFLKNGEKKLFVCYFIYNIVFDYCIVRFECVLGCIVCFRFVLSIGGKDLF